MDEITERITNWLKGKKSPPYSVELHPTWRCNLKCIYCNAWHTGEITDKNIHNFSAPPERMLYPRKNG